jgi:hypothetical protein
VARLVPPQSLSALVRFINRQRGQSQ